MIKVVSGIAVHPDIIVMTLNGKGVIPAVKTAKKPKLLKRLLNSYIASVLPSAVKMGCPRLSKAIAPIKYPRIPPNTDDIHATVAINQARFGAAKIIGIINTSGGIGKMELSINAIKAKTHKARG